MVARWDAPPERPSTPSTGATTRPGNISGGRAPSWTSLFDPRQPEAFLAFCSLWCSMQMWFWPDEFSAANALVTFQVGLRGHEQAWAMFGSIAALLKLSGLASRMSMRWRVFSDGLLASGLFMSIVFWMIVGISRVVDFPHSITPVALTGLGLAAAFQLAQQRDPRETWK
jgi:hypothetical protein